MRLFKYDKAHLTQQNKLTWIIFNFISILYQNYNTNIKRLDFVLKLLIQTEPLVSILFSTVLCFNAFSKIITRLVGEYFQRFAPSSMLSLSRERLFSIILRTFHPYKFLGPGSPSNCLTPIPHSWQFIDLIEAFVNTSYNRCNSA